MLPFADVAVNATVDTCGPSKRAPERVESATEGATGRVRRCCHHNWRAKNIEYAETPDLDREMRPTRVDIRDVKQARLAASRLTIRLFAYVIYRFNLRCINR